MLTAAEKKRTAVEPYLLFHFTFNVPKYLWINGARLLDTDERLKP
jgi:hypothetical protein